MTTFYGSATKQDYRDLVNLKKCWDTCLQEAIVKAGSLPTQKERDDFLDKAKDLKKSLDGVNAALFHIETAKFGDYVTAFKALDAQTKLKLAHLQSIVDNLQTTVQVVSALDDALVIAAGIASQMP